MTPKGLPVAGLELLPVAGKIKVWKTEIEFRGRPTERDEYDSRRYGSEPKPRLLEQDGI